MCRIQGVAVMVAPGIALCAAHVLLEDVEDLRSGAKQVLCVGIASEKRQIWGVTNIGFVPTTDLVILSLKLIDGLSTSRRFNYASITTRAPRSGETVTIMGFRSDGSTFNWKQGEEKISIVSLACRGRVIEHYVPRRDCVLLPGPSMAVDCPSWSGMSGAPVFDGDGWLIGILSTSLETADALPKPSGVSLLWHALGYPFVGGWPEPESPAPRTLLAMSAAGFCQIERPEVLKENGQDEEGMPQYVYYTWQDREPADASKPIASSQGPSPT